MATTDTSAAALFFLGLLPPATLHPQFTALKQEFAERLESRHALRSPPHITVFPPFRWPLAWVAGFDCLTEFARQHAPIAVTVFGFGAFAPRVIYARPLQTPALLALHQDLHRCSYTVMETRAGLSIVVMDKIPYGPNVIL